MFIVKLMLKTANIGHYCDGYIHKNKSGKYYPDAEHAFMFNSVNEAMFALEEVQSKESNSKYTIIEWNVINIDLVSKIAINNDFVITDISGLRDILESVITSELKDYKVPLDINLKVGLKDESNEISIEYLNNIININSYGFTVQSTPIQGSALSRKSYITLTDRLIEKINSIVLLYMSGKSVKSYLSKLDTVS